MKVGDIVEHGAMELGYWRIIEINGDKARCKLIACKENGFWVFEKDYETTFSIDTLHLATTESVVSYLMQNYEKQKTLDKSNFVLRAIKEDILKNNQQ